MVEKPNLLSTLSQVMTTISDTATQWIPDADTVQTTIATAQTVKEAATQQEEPARRQGHQLL